mgnify:CR=1 FL=1
MVAVIVVVALVAGPAVIGAVGAAAGALGASAATASAIGAIVGGAIVGAASGAVIQMGNNVIDGKNLMDDVGKAAIVGAIGGALGGAGGVLGNTLANAGKLGTGMTQSVLKFGIDTALDVAGGLLGDLSVGNPITLEGVLIGAGIGAAVSISTANLGSLGKLGSRIEGIQTNFQNRGARFGDAAGTRFGEAVGLPAGGNRPTLDIETPSTRSGVEVEAPKTGQGESVPTTETGSAPREVGETKPTVSDTQTTSTRTTQEPPAPKNSDDTADISGAKPESQSIRESSVEESGHIESNQLSDRQIKNELDQINENPDILQGTPPNRKARIGEHEWHEQPGGGWCRHSNSKVCVPSSQVPIKGARTLRPDQVDLSAIPENSIINSSEGISAVVGDGLKATGRHKKELGGLYSFIRNGGGAGFQGVTAKPVSDNSNIVLKNFKTSQGEVIAAIDVGKIDPKKVFDLSKNELRTQFLESYPRFHGMYDRLASEGVIAINGDIPVEAIAGLLRPSSSADNRAIKNLLSQLFQ